MEEVATHPDGGWIMKTPDRVKRATAIRSWLDKLLPTTTRPDDPLDHLGEKP